MYPDIPISEYAWIKRHDPKHGVLPEYSFRVHLGVVCYDGRRLSGVTLRLGRWELRLTLFRPRLYLG